MEMTAGSSHCVLTVRLTLAAIIGPSVPMLLCIPKTLRMPTGAAVGGWGEMQHMLMLKEEMV